MRLKRSSSRHATALAFLTGVVLVLTGCETYYQYGPYALGTDGENLLIAACEARTITTVYVEERPDLPGVEGRRHVWEASGDRTIAAGEVLVVGGENAGLVDGVSLQPTIEPGVRYFLDMNEEKGQVTSALFMIPEEGLSAGEWVTPEGDVSSQPCPNTT
ncbi:hypothetical protein [Microbacterium sp. LWH11-1.2]|uniref:hypothetical protein n=1 Tax=Microbacterium sp. LWH11-1.2 TaxID=3135258 RepID=UPI00313A1606